VTIEPVPCALDRWRYDHLPQGRTTVNVSLFDRSGNPAGGGSVQVDLESEVPSSPTTLDLN
jgi:hypothetical protein